MVLDVFSHDGSKKRVKFIKFDDDNVMITDQGNIYKETVASLLEVKETQSNEMIPLKVRKDGKKICSRCGGSGIFRKFGECFGCDGLGYKA